MSNNGNLRIVGLVTAAIVLLGACGDDSDDGLSRGELVDRLVEEAEADADEQGVEFTDDDEAEVREYANCVIDAVGEDEVNRVIEADEAGEDVSADEEEEVATAIFQCAGFGDLGDELGDLGDDVDLDDDATDRDDEGGDDATDG
jgi:hypothetical protein